MKKHCNEWLPAFIAINLIWGLFGIVGIVVFVKGAQQEINILMIITGMLASKVNTLVDYFFGTSLPKMKKKKNADNEEDVVKEE